MTKSFPIGCIPVSSHFQVGTFIINGYITTTMPPTSMSTMITDQQLMHHGTQHTTPLPFTAQSIWDGQVILATDGSVKHEIMTYAWIILTMHKQQHQTGHCQQWPSPSKCTICSSCIEMTGSSRPLCHPTMDCKSPQMVPR